MINVLSGETITGSEKELQKTNEKEFRIENVLKRKGDKLYVKWKGSDNSFNILINKKDLVEKWANTFLSRLEVVEGTLMLKLIFTTMQQKLI